MNKKELDAEYSPYNKVVQDNILVQAVHSMNRNELILFKQAISQIDSKNPSEKVVLKREDIFRILKVNKETGTYYSKIKKYSKAVNDSVIHLKDSESETWLNLAVEVRWSKNNDSLAISFNSKLLPFLLNLKENFTQYQIGYLSYLKSKYSIRLYELLKMNEFKQKWIVPIDEFRKILDIQKSYKDIHNLDKFVLGPAMREINESTDLVVSFDKKRGRYNKVTDLVFKIKLKPMTIENQV